MIEAAAKEIISLLKALVYGTTVVTRAYTFQKDQNFDFLKISGGKGVRDFTIQNIGDYDIVLKDNGQIIIPGESFTIQGNYSIVNDSFEVAFGSVGANITSSSPVKNMAVRYAVQVCK